ncbi:hypothetical protein [Mycobacterium riyadhense]
MSSNVLGFPQTFEKHISDAAAVVPTTPVVPAAAASTLNASQFAAHGQL